MNNCDLIYMAFDSYNSGHSLGVGFGSNCNRNREAIAQRTRWRLSQSCNLVCRHMTQAFSGDQMLQELFLRAAHTEANVRNLKKDTTTEAQAHYCTLLANTWHRNKTHCNFQCGGGLNTGNTHKQQSARNALFVMLCNQRPRKQTHCLCAHMDNANH